MDRRTTRDYLSMRRSRDGRNPYGSRGGYVDTRNPYGSRGGYVDSRMDRAYDRRDYNSNDYQYDSRRNDRAYTQQDNARGRRDYQQSGQSDMAGMDYNDMNRHYIRDYNDMDYYGNDGHYPTKRGGSTYYPIEAMGTFNGYYGMPEDRDYAGDYGENLSKEELQKWNKKLMKEIDEKDKQFFKKEMISQKARTMGIPMEDFNEEELLTATLMMYTDYSKALKRYVGSNMDIYLLMAKDFLTDPDASVKGSEKLAVYHDCIVEEKEENDD